MRRSIVFKLFLLTTGLCVFVIAAIFIGQTLFFKQFYVHQKINDVKKALQAYELDTMKLAVDAEQSAKLEQQFYEQHDTWIATLNDKGALQYTDDFFIEVELEHDKSNSAFSGRTITIPLYSFISVENFYSNNPFLEPWVKAGEQIALEGLIMNEQLVIQRMARSDSYLRSENRLENRQMVDKEYEVVTRYDATEQYFDDFQSVLFKGTITKLQIPERTAASRYTNQLLLDRINAFQADLLYGDYIPDDADHVIDYEENHVQYKILIKSVRDPHGNPAYLFAITSLQPVNEAAELIKSYYGYIMVGVLLLVMLISFYYSRRIAKPLLRINQTAQQMAALDFSEKIPVSTKDEIGDLSHSINQLSERLHAHIVRLEQDIEKEKQLEHTRKEFISGVSHELKTPLSVIQSCLSILKDGIASHKRDHYFTAMEHEVNQMNLLIGDMLELAKYESGTYNMEMESFNIAFVLERMCEKFAADIDSKHLRLHKHLQPIEVIANRRRIEQVLVNFLTNAIRYTPQQEAIIVEVSELRDTVQISIENRGVHIADEQLEKIWDRFYRGEPSRQRATGGTGLGLAISRKILQMHGVSYGATNTTNGVMFYFQLNKKV